MMYCRDVAAAWKADTPFEGGNPTKWVAAHSVGYSKLD